MSNFFTLTGLRNNVWNYVAEKRSREDLRGGENLEPDRGQKPRRMKHQASSRPLFLFAKLDYFCRMLLTSTHSEALLTYLSGRGSSQHTKGRSEKSFAAFLFSVLYGFDSRAPVGLPIPTNHAVANQSETSGLQSLENDLPMSEGTPGEKSLWGLGGVVKVPCVPLANVCDCLDVVE